MNEQESHKKDSKLAREIGRLLEQGQKPENAEDPLSNWLHTYKQLKEQQVDKRVSEVDSDDLWDRIQQNISEPETSTKTAPVYSLFSRHAYRWAAAALVLIAVLAGYFFYSTTYDPSLIASSGSQIETVQLSDGSQVTLRPHSQLHKRAVNPNKRSYRLSGEALFEVKQQDDRPFSVQANRGRVTVTGTRFTLSSWGRNVRVYVQEGSVRFESTEDSNYLALEQGKAAEIGSETNIPQLLEADKKIFTDWLDQQAIFDNEKTRYVFAEIEHHFKISIKAPEKIMNERISGRLHLEKRDTALQDLGLVLGGTFKKTGERTYMFVHE